MIINSGPPKASKPAEATHRRRVDALMLTFRALKSIHDQTRSPRLGLVDLDTSEIKNLKQTRSAAARVHESLSRPNHELHQPA
jgi:hypothetical protein